MITQDRHKDFQQRAEAYLTTTTVHNPRTGEVYETASKEISEIYAAFYRELIGTFDSLRNGCQEPEYDEGDDTDSENDDGRDAGFERERPLVIEWPRDEERKVLRDDDVQDCHRVWPGDGHDNHDQELQDLEAEPEDGSPARNEQTGSEDELPNGGYPTSHDSVQDLSSTCQQWLQLTTDSEFEDNPEILAPYIASPTPSPNEAPTDNEVAGNRIKETIIEYTLPRAPQPAPLTSPALSPVSPTDIYDPVRRISIPRPPRVDSLLPLLRSNRSSSAASSVYSRDEDDIPQASSSRSSGIAPYTSMTSSTGRPLLAAVQHRTDSDTGDPDTPQRDNLRGSSLFGVEHYDQSIETEQPRPTSLPAHMVLAGDEAEQMLALTGYVPLHRLSLEVHDEPPLEILQEDCQKTFRSDWQDSQENSTLSKKHQRRPRPVQLERVSTHSLGNHADVVDAERYRHGSTSSSLAAYHAYDERTNNLSAPLERRLSGIRSFRSYLSLHRKLERYVEGLQQQTAGREPNWIYAGSVINEGLVGLPYSDTVRGPTPVTDLTAESSEGGSQGPKMLKRTISRLSRKRSVSLLSLPYSSSLSSATKLTVLPLNIDQQKLHNLHTLQHHLDR